MDDGEHLLSLDHDEEGPTVSFSKERTLFTANSRPALNSSAFHFPLSSSTPSSLGELSTLNPGTAAGPSTISSIIKSSSVSSESKESALLRPKPMLSLVESLSTEISRHQEPEVCLFKSDSKLHLQPWKQLSQRSKAQQIDSLPKTAPSSPTESRPNLMGSGSLLMAELEDTRRKFSEVMQEPLSMFNKFIGEDGGSPKTQKGLPASQGGAAVEMPIQNEEEEWCHEDRSTFAACETPIRRPRTTNLSSKLGSESSHYKISTYGDVMQVVEIQQQPSRMGFGESEQKSSRAAAAMYTTSPDPIRWLVCVGLLVYSFFVLPLSSYVTGLFLGLACGFMLGLAVVMKLPPKQPAVKQKPNPSQTVSQLMESMGKVTRDPLHRVLQGWMNEMYDYDPETYHPSLCHSVYARLEGCQLRLAYPLTNIPRQATFNEPTHDTTFVRSRCFRLTNSKVSLVPAALAKKRVWNKKYPIRIMLAEEVESGDEEQVYEAVEADSERAGKPQQMEKEASPTFTLYLFGRTGREKEEWYQHFQLASRTEIQTRFSQDESQTDVCSVGGSSQGSTDDLTSMLGLRELAGSVREKILLDYSSYMARVVTSDSCSLTPSPCHSEPGSPTDTRKFSVDQLAGCGNSAWINALIGRIFWDFLQEKYWAEQVAYKIQKKLSRIRLPYFMNELTLGELNMGTCMPQVLGISRPSVDHRGLWLDLEVDYGGSLHMTLETKMNLCKLGRENVSEAYRITEPSILVGSRSRLCVIADSDEESSSAASSDEETPMPSELQGTAGYKTVHLGTVGPGGSTGRKILRFVDKIAKSRCFQKATENEYIKKKITEVSNTPLLLTVEVLELSGSLTVNIPPPPTDRIWYGFRAPPTLDLRVKPMLGERELTFSQVTEWIERKLQCEFQKFFVMPNMDDLYLPLMSSGMDNPASSQNCSGVIQDQQEHRDSE